MLFLPKTHYQIIIQKAGSVALAAEPVVGPQAETISTSATLEQGDSKVRIHQALRFDFLNNEFITFYNDFYIFVRFHEQCETL